MLTWKRIFVDGHPMWISRPLPTNDVEFEAVALRLAEAGILSDLRILWEDSPMSGDPTDAEAAEHIRAMVDRICGYLGRDVEVFYGSCEPGRSAPWWDAAGDGT